MKRWIQLPLIMLAIGTASGPANSQGQPLTLGATLDSRDTDVSINVLKEAYHRAGMSVEVRRYAGDIALLKANSGEVDGDVGRMDGITPDWPNLIQVQVPINHVEIAVYSTNAALRLSSWRDLEHLNVAIVRGVPSVAASTQGLPVRMVDSYGELFRLAERGEANAIVAPVIEAEQHFRENGNPSRLVRIRIMDTYLLYHYLHRRHDLLASRIAPILMQMLREGSMARIRKATYAESLPLHQPR